MARVKGRTVDLDYRETLLFFERRAANAQPHDYLAITVFRSREEAEQRHVAERNQVLAALGFSASSRVLEIGCGAGRWATTLLTEIPSPVCRYVGVDFSPALIALAKRVHPNDSAKFMVMSADSLDETALAAEGQFSHAIICALILYLNDEAVARLLSSIARLIVPGGKLYLREPICIDSQRLTLVEEYSDALHDRYNAVYRTDAELRTLIKATGAFAITASSDLEGVMFSSFSETRHHYYLAECVR